jgi:hypothetical protein
MSLLETVAKEFQVSPETLLNESLKEYLKQQLVKIEADIFLVAKKYGTKDVFELDAKIKEGFIHETEAHDDYFRMDYLEAERDKIRQMLDKF